MEKYILSSEKKRINFLTNEMAHSLKIDINHLNSIEIKVINILKKNKDKDITDILNSILEELIKEMIPLLEENTTPGIEFGIKNKHFMINAYGGYYNSYKEKEITSSTMFSIDSISKLLTSSLTYLDSVQNNWSLDTPLSKLNNEFLLTSDVKSILNFSAMIRTKKRIDNLPPDETITILKETKELLEEKKNYYNFYEYNDIGYMILRQSINDFLSKLDLLLKQIGENNITYDNIKNKDNITGGKLNEEYVTPDTKGRGIMFPGHTGLYANIDGLLSIFAKIIFNNTILNDNDKKNLFNQPYDDPYIHYQKMKNPYMTKTCGIYRKPRGITDNTFNKLSYCDMSNMTTEYKSYASAGTCGSWLVGDNLNYNDKFGYYIGGILSNPYSSVEKKEYPDAINDIPNSALKVNKKGVIIGYQTKLNCYKEIITEYGLILEIITEYLKETDEKSLTTFKKLSKKINSIP